MSLSILIVTPNRAFGELVRQSLGEIDSYQITVAGTGAEAIEACQSSLYNLAVLDSDLQDMPISQLGQKLLETHPDMRTLVIQSMDNPTDGEGFTAQAYLSKPFYLPDFLDTARKLLPTADVDDEEVIQAVTEVEETEAGETTWQQDARLAARMLSQLSFDISIPAVMILRSGHLWAYSSNLSRAAVEELSASVAVHWDPKQNTDLTRYSRESSSNTEYMLYATQLSRELVLCVVFSASQVFSRARSQTLAAARMLLENTHTVENVQYTAPAAIEEQPAAVDEGWMLNEEDTPLTAAELEQIHSLPPLLEDVPSPDPQADAVPVSWFMAESGMPLEGEEDEEEELPAGEETKIAEEKLPTIPALELEPEAGIDLPIEPVFPALEFEPEASAGLPLGTAVPVETPDEGAPVEEPDEETLPTPAVASDWRLEEPSLEGIAPTTPPIHEWLLEEPAPGETGQATTSDSLLQIEEPPIDPLADTKPTHGGEAQPSINMAALELPDDLEVDLQNATNIAYTFIIIPDLANHYLIGQLAACLSQCLPEICQANNWQIGRLSIRPGFLLMTVETPADTFADELIQKVRKAASESIFKEFPTLKQYNNQEDFWAPGSLLMNGTQPPSQRLIQNFIEQSRQRRGSVLATS